MKQMKILGVLAIAATLGLTACGGGGGKKSSSKHTHKWGEYVTVKEATCTEPGTQERECSECHEKQTKSIPAAHNWGEWETVTAPTCTEAGSRKHTCSVCQQEESETVDATGHTWGEWETVSAPDCTNPGSRKHVCSVCQVEESEEVPANGHTWGEWEEITAPTCTEKGSHKHTCSVCNVEETEDVPALGHDIQLIGDETEPEAGKAKVRVYTCANNCGITYLGFKASEVSEESKNHLSFTESTKADGTKEVGASFWGRPIGNALALKADGSSVAEQVDECVYCSTETGDFFEYIFDLTAEQVEQAGLDECRLYLDAKPANYMNGGDFFAYGGGNTDDWTPGFYIDGADDHIEKDEGGQPVMVKDHERSVRAEDGSEAEGVEKDTEVPMGKRITDYRYILYVDDQVQQFEQNVSNPTHGNNTNMTREEFCLPFVFRLHAGENKIRLCMAGGYRSTFYNFTFRPVEEEVPPEPPVVDEWVEDTTMAAPETGAALVKRYTKGEDVKYEIDVKTANMTVDSDSDWKTKPETGAFKLNNGKTATFNFALPKAFSGKMYQSCYMDSYNSNKTKKMFYQTNSHCNIEVKVNGNAIDFSKYENTTFQEVFGDETNGSNSLTKEVELGDVVLESGNVITYKRVETLNMLVEKFVFIGKDHDHAYTAGEKAADSALRPVTCACGASGYELQAADLTEGQKAPVASDKNTRLGKNVFDDVWNITGIKAGKYALYLNAQNSSGNDNAYWNAATAIANGDRASNNGSTAEQQADYRYKVKIDNGEYTPIANDTERYSDFGMSAAAAAWTSKPVAVLTIAEGAASLTISNMNNGYSIWIYAARLLPVA